MDEAKSTEEVKDTKVEDKPINKSGLMSVKAYSPFKTYFEGEASSVSAASATGEFDVLGQHHNFITLLVPCDVIIRTPKGEEVIAIGGGIMHVKKDQVVIFLDV